jgi:hypothetical protein
MPGISARSLGALLPFFLLSALSTVALRYNASLDPWNINKNQGESSFSLTRTSLTRQTRSRSSTTPLLVGRATRLHLEIGG